MSILESEIDKNLLNGFWGFGSRQTECSDTVEVALDKMMMTDQHQHSDGLLQEFYLMTQQTNEPTGKYTVQLDLVAGKVCLQSREALANSEEERGRLLIASLEV